MFLRVFPLTASASVFFPDFSPVRTRLLSTAPVSFFIPVFASAILFLSTLAQAASFDLSPHDPSYPLLRRLQTHKTAVFYTQAFPQDQKHFEYYLRSGTPDSPYDRYYLRYHYPWANTSLVQWEGLEKKKTFNLSPYVFSEFYDSSSTQMLGGLGLRLYGQVRENISFYTNGRVFTEKSSEEQYTHQFDPDYGETCSAEQRPDGELLDSRTCARFEYYLLFDFDWMDLKVGRDHLHMGPGYFSSLTATRQTAPYYLVEGRLDFSEWLVLDNYFLKMTDGNHHVRKWAHIHRLEYKPTAALSLAFQDAVIYQQREPDPIYFIPLIPLAFAEDNSGGRDNDAMSFDFLYTGLPHFSMWGEMFIDDLLGPSTFFDDFWENRWAVLAGFQVTSPWRPLDMDFIFEYSRVEPWTYAGRDRYTSFRHFDRHSASKLGPNSRSLDFQLAYRPLPWIELVEHLAMNDKGLDAGSNVRDIHDNAKHGTTKEFLGGPTQSDVVWSHTLRGQWRQFFSGEFTVSQLFGDLDGYRLSSRVLVGW